MITVYRACSSSSSSNIRSLSFFQVRGVRRAPEVIVAAGGSDSLPRHHVLPIKQVACAQAFPASQASDHLDRKHRCNRSASHLILTVWTKSLHQSCRHSWKNLVPFLATSYNPGCMDELEILMVLGVLRWPAHLQLSSSASRGDCGVLDGWRGGVTCGYLYLKRLVGIGGEKLRIGNDQHLVVNGHRLNESTPGFRNVYEKNLELRPPGVKGHLNREMLQAFRFAGSTAKLSPVEHTEFEVPPGQYVVMGDNTASSADSRSWGSLPQENVFGSAWPVWWPVNPAWGSSLGNET